MRPSGALCGNYLWMCLRHEYFILLVEFSRAGLHGITEITSETLMNTFGVRMSLACARLQTANLTDSPPNHTSLLKGLHD